MEYIKLRVTFDFEDENRFYRELLVKEDISLIDLGCAILTSLRSDFSHCFYFKDKDYNYMPKVFMEDFVRKNDILMNNHTLKDLSNEFIFLYDTGEGYLFKCKKNKDLVEYDSNSNEDECDDVILVGGKGIGIYEDNINTLYCYLEGKMKKDNLNVSKKLGTSIPHNLEIGQWGDFDKYDLEEAKREFNGKVIYDREAYKQGEEEYNKSKNGDYPYDEDEDDCDEEALAKSNIDFYNSINSMLDVLIKENKSINEEFKYLKKKMNKDEALDVMAKALVMELYECGKRSIAFDTEEYFMMLDTLTNEEIQ